MLDTLLAKVVGTQNERELKRLRPIVAQVNAELAPFRKQFGETVVTYLTPAQLAAGCIPPPPGGPPGGRRGGPPPAPPVDR